MGARYGCVLAVAMVWALLWGCGNKNASRPLELPEEEDIEEVAEVEEQDEKDDLEGVDADEDQADQEDVAEVVTDPDDGIEASMEVSIACSPACGTLEHCFEGRCVCQQHWEGPGCEQSRQEIRIPAEGSQVDFLMGNDGRWGWPPADEVPAHWVSLRAYFIDREEVSAVSYLLCVLSGACSEPMLSAEYGTYGAVELLLHPVNGVTWVDAWRYCRWAGKRLPTEAEWERAAKGELGALFPWGEACPASWLGLPCWDPEWSLGTSLANCHDIYCRDPYPETAPTMAFVAGASPEGLLNLAGNVREWVNDWYAPTAYASGPVTNPQGPGEGTRKVLRGGGFLSPPRHLRTTARSHLDPAAPRPDVGFRCARDGF